MSVNHGLAFGALIAALSACSTSPHQASDEVAQALEDLQKNPSSAGPGGTPTVVKGRIIVETRAGLSRGNLANILDAHGGKARQIGKSNLYIVDLPASASETAIAAVLAKNPHLKAAEPDQRIAPQFVSNDPYLGSEWHLAKINAASAWDRSQGAGVTIAVLDSGVDPSHPDLAPRLVPGWNFYDNNANTADVFGHGTKVAGVAAAIGNNGIGVAGVASQSNVMPIRVTDLQGYAYASTIAQGLTWAADQGVRVANVSFEVAGISSVISAANYLRSKGGLVANSAGNSGVNSSTPATTSMIVVSATDSNDVRASWSNYGPSITVAAPGVSIWTSTSGGGYSAVSGTSFAAPVTAGVISLMMAANSTLPNTQVESLLFSTAADLGATGRDIEFGYGRVNADAAVRAAAAAISTADLQAPALSIGAPLANSTVSGWVQVDIGATDNVGVSKVELRANGVLVGTDTAAPFSFSWDSTAVPNGLNNLVGTAYDGAGNSANSSVLTVNVSNSSKSPPDTSPPVLGISNPKNGSVVSGTLSVQVSATDDSGSAGISQTLLIDGVKVASASGGSLSYSWNTRKLTAGAHTIQAIARDAAGNSATATISVSK